MSPIMKFVACANCLVEWSEQGTVIPVLNTNKRTKEFVISWNVSPTYNSLLR